MTTPPPRKRFQIHLSTAIVMMFVAGALIWANIEKQPVQVWQLNPIDGGDFGDIYFGWPFTAAVSRLSDEYSPESQRNPVFFLTLFCAIDIVVAIGILFTTLFLCEWLIRRRAARTGG